VHAIGFDSAHQNLRDLRPDSALLDAIRKDFQNLHSKAQQENNTNGDGGMKVYTFKEAKGITGIGFANLNNKASSLSQCQFPSLTLLKIVPDESSEFPGSAGTFTIPADHRMMSRYWSKESIGYKRVSGTLRTLEEETMNIAEIEQKQC
jgi:hypothetical protein